MSLQYAAHVDHPISHHSETVQLDVAAIGILVTVTIVMTGGTAGLVALAATGTGVAINAAAPIDKALPVESGAGVIASGFPTVLLGPGIKPAARAKSFDTMSGKCHVDQVFEGSKIVMIGEGAKPMSRRGDRIGPKCAGMIADGIHTIMVGGNPSEEGVELEEKDSEVLHEMKMMADAIGGTATIVKGALVQGLTQIAAVLLDAGGQDNASSVAKALAMRPSDLTEGGGVAHVIGGADSAITTGKAVTATGNIVSGKSEP